LKFGAAVRDNVNVASETLMNDAEKELQKAAERVCQAPALFEGFYPVFYLGRVTWEGVVHQFACEKCRAYAWVVERSEGPEYIAVLQGPEADSPMAAVRRWAADEEKK
jgi:hypothetical protein